MLAKSTEIKTCSQNLCNQVLKSDKIQQYYLVIHVVIKIMMKSEEFIIIEVSITIITTRQKMVCDLGEMGSGGDVYSTGVFHLLIWVVIARNSINDCYFIFHLSLLIYFTIE